MNRLVLAAAGVAAALSLIACGDDDDSDGVTPTTAAATSTRAAETTPTVANTPTRAATTASTPTSAPTTSSTPGTDGTVAPQNAGDTDSKTVKANPDPLTGSVIVTHLRLGYQQEEGGWERIVFEFQGAQRPPATIEYVASAAQCGSGQAVTLPGQKILAVTMRQTDAHNQQGQPTLDNGKKEVTTPPGGNTILKGVQSCDFEGVVQWVFGLKGEQRFKVTTLENPTRIVIDIKQ